MRQSCMGKFCQTITGMCFIIKWINHLINYVSTYPFKVFNGEWSREILDVKNKKDTIIGNDIWIGWRYSGYYYEWCKN